MKLGRSIVYIEGSHNILSKDINFAFILLQIDLVMANSADPDEIPVFVEIYVGLCFVIHNSVSFLVLQSS